MPITPEQKQYYLSCIHELNRAIFFKNCPNYVNMMDAEIARLDASDPAYNSVNKNDIDNFSKARPFGTARGTDLAETIVTSRTGAQFRRKGVPNT